MKNLLILGAGGHGHVVAETARSMTDAEGNPLYDIKKRISGSFSGSWKL